MNPDTGEMAYIADEELKKAFKQADDESVDRLGKCFGSLKEATDNGFVVPFNVGENINIKGCHFRVNNFVQKHSFMNLKLIKKDDDPREAYTLKKEPFAWMRGWLEAYAKENELNVDEIMNWIFNQPMGC